MNGWGSFQRDLLEQLPLIFAGLVKTLQLAGLISVSGLLLGIGVFYLTLSKSKLIRSAINSYISFFIGMPLIVLLFLMYYGLPQWGVRLSPFTVAFIGFTFNVAAARRLPIEFTRSGLLCGLTVSVAAKKSKPFWDA